VIVDNGLCEPVLLVSRSLCDQRGSNLTSLIGYTVRWDRRNDPIRPTRGFDVTARQDLAGLGGDVNYLRSEIDASAYYGIRPEWIVTLNTSAGYIEGFSGDRVRINDRFFKGGNTFRGFETAGIGPRDVTFDDPLGGKIYAIGSVELSFPTPLPEEYGIDGALFLDVGTLGRVDDSDKLTRANPPMVDPNIRDDLSLRASAGVSVFWDSPLGPIRFDFSQVLAREDYDNTETFRFSTNTRF
jgi:outer membrane protein insertion porin family